MFKIVIILFASVFVAGNKNCIKPGCDSCFSGYSYKNISCLEICPTGFALIDSSCIPGDSLFLFEIEFYNHLNFSSTSIQNFTHPLRLPFNEPLRRGPIPSKTQGFYFESTSSLISTNSYILSPDFCFTLFVKSFSPGEIFKIQDNSSKNLEIISTSSSIEIFIKISNSTSSVMKQTHYTTSRFWTIFSFKSIQSRSYIILSNSYENTPILDFEFQMTSNSSIFEFGSLNSQGFQGFLYYFCMRNDAGCYYKTLSAPACDLFSYVDLSCKTCDEKCGNWPICTRKSCNVCYSIGCSDCNGFGSEHCLKCEEEGLDQCIKARNCVRGSGFKCEECEKGMVLKEGICVREYFKFLPLNIKFDQIRQFHGGVFQSGSNSSTYAPFHNPDKDDPLPLKNRGYYLDSGQYFFSPKLNLNYKFTLLAWVSVKNYINLIQTELIQVFFDGIVRIRLRNYEEFRLFIVNNNCNFEDWKLIGLILDFKEGTSYIHSVCNKKIELKVQAKGYAFYDFNNYFNITAANYFYLYQLVLIPYADFTITESLDLCSDYSKDSCLWPPFKNQYFNQVLNKFEECDKRCRDGCATFASCTQCKYLDCKSCSGFDEDCEITANTCLDGFWLSDDRMKCCDIRCANCYGLTYFYCLSCRNGFYLDGKRCLYQCPSEYQIQGRLCIPPEDSVVFSCLFNKNLKFTKSKSIIFTLAANKEISDKMPTQTVGRGIYIQPGSFVFSSEMIMSSQFSLLIWVKIENHGVLIKKGKLFIDSNILLMFSNYSLEFPSVTKKLWTLVVFNFYENDGVYNILLKSLLGFYSKSEINGTIFEDSSSSIIFGSDRVDGFKGFLWKVSLFSSWNMNGTTFEVCNEGINTHCLWDCDLSHYFEGNSCKPCLSLCPEGCARGSDCSICPDPNCKDCISLKEKCNCAEGFYSEGSKCIQLIPSSNLITQDLKINDSSSFTNTNDCFNLNFDLNLIICSQNETFSVITFSSLTQNFLSLACGVDLKLILYLSNSPNFCDRYIKLTSSNLILSKNDFEFIRVIGRGGFGEVWEVTLKSNFITYAVKLIPRSRLSSSFSIGSIKREKELMAELFSRFIVNLQFSFADEENFYLGFDLMAGGSLRFHMVSGIEFSEEQAKFIVCSVALALEYIHKHGLIHQDIKPDNILFDSSGRVFVMDFGLSIPLILGNDSAYNGGTTGYMSPEVAFKKPKSYSSDYFPLGVILYEIIFKTKPFKGKSSQFYENLKLLDPKIQESPKSWSFESVDFCFKLLEKSAKRRLGALGSKQIKSHPWVKNFDWEKLKNWQLKPFFEPQIKDNFNYEDMSTWSANAGNLEESQENLIKIEEIARDFYFYRGFVLN